MPRLLYGAPWTMGEEQADAYREDGYEPLAPHEGHEPYLYIDGRQLRSGELILVARDGCPPFFCEVVGCNPAKGFANVKLPIMRDDGPFEVRFTLSAGTLVKRKVDGVEV
jgi:hypothetical protein